MAAELVQGNAPRGDDTQIARRLGLRAIQRLQRLRGAPVSKLRAPEFKQDAGVILAPGRGLAQGMFPAPRLAKIAVAAPEPDKRLDGIGVRGELATVQGGGRLVVALRRGTIRKAQRRGFRL